MERSIKDSCENVFDGMDSEYEDWKPYHKEVGLYLDPRRQAFDNQRSRSRKNENKKIIDPSATLSLRTSSSGMYSGICNPATKWIGFSVDDKDLNKFHSVRLYLNVCAELVLKALSGTNFYDVAPGMFTEILSYSTTSLGMQPDEEDILRFYPNPMGSYRMATGPRQSVDTHGRRYSMRTSQIVKRFGLENCSDAVKSAYKSGVYHKAFEVKHLVFDNPDYVPTAFSNMHKTYASVWYEPGGNDGQVLSRSGFDEFPFITPRWEVLGNDVWGSFGPGMLALGTIKGLQKDIRDRHDASNKMLNPALVAPDGLKSANTFAGGITYMPANQGTQKLEPIHNVNYPINYALQAIEDDRKIIDQAFFKDIFLAVLDVNKSGVTAYEIAQRKEEKMILLGPVLTRFNKEGLDPIVSMMFKEMNRRGLLPQAPEELRGTKINIDYMGTLQQAQKAVGIAGIERTISFIGNLSGTNDQVLDKINFDSVVDIYQDITGTTPEILNPDDVVASIREGKAQAAQAQQMAAMAQPAQQGAAAAKLLSETDTSSDNGLTNMMGI